MRRTNRKYEGKQKKRKEKKKKEKEKLAAEFVPARTSRNDDCSNSKPLVMNPLIVGLFFIIEH